MCFLHLNFSTTLPVMPYWYDTSVDLYFASAKGKEELQVHLRNHPLHSADMHRCHSGLEMRTHYKPQKTRLQSR